MIIEAKYATIRYTDFGVETIFHSDGAVVSAWPHPEQTHYYVISHRLGYGDDIMRYCREHEACHSLVEEFLHDRPSQVLWSLAHGKLPRGAEAAYEEMAAQQLQRWVRAHERPILSGVDWDKVKRDAIELLGA